MHVPHHLPAADQQTRLQPRKPVVEKEGLDHYARITEQSDDRHRGSTGSQRQRKTPDAPEAAGFEGESPVVKPFQPFMAMTGASGFWTKLAMASAEETIDHDGCVGHAPQQGQ